jgi:integrase
MEGPVIVVVFEVWPAQGRKDDYLGIAAALRADLDRIDGFISIERGRRLERRNGQGLRASEVAGLRVEDIDSARILTCCGS